MLSQAEAGALVVRQPDVAAATDRLAGAVRALAWSVGAVGAGGLAVAVGSGAGAVALGVAAGACALGALRAGRR